MSSKTVHRSRNHHGGGRRHRLHNQPNDHQMLLGHPLHVHGNNVEAENVNFASNADLQLSTEPSQIVYNQHVLNKKLAEWNSANMDEREAATEKPILPRATLRCRKPIWCFLKIGLYGKFLWRRRLVSQYCKTYDIL